MKKLLFIAVFVITGLGTVNAQKGSFNAGVNLGLPIGDNSNINSLGISVEANYLFDVSDKFKVGPSISYLHYIGKDNVLGKSSSFLPIAAAGRYSVSEKLTLGADLGYGIGISPGDQEGAPYYRPMVGYTISEKIMLQATYTAMSKEGFTMSNLGVGAMISL
jgi:hypothetical protein